MEKQTTSHLMLIRPYRFKYNPQTAVNNAFQEKDKDQEAVAKQADEEFEQLLQTLKANGIHAFAINDTAEPATPDSLFPNNWISTHADGQVYLYPMFAENRRGERKPSVLEYLKMHYHLREITDFSPLENQQQFLEGTGSMVLDRTNKIAYACLSPRTDLGAFRLFCEDAGYTPIAFDAVDQDGQPIYHTNVMMALADRYVVICSDSVKPGPEKEALFASLEKTGKTIVNISFAQMNHFAGNMLQVENGKGEKILVMSTQAWQSLDAAQVEQLTSFNKILHSDISTIEKNGGGSVRCMLAEIHLVKK